MLIPFDYLFQKYNVKCTGLLHAGGSTGQERMMYHKLLIPFVYWIEAIPNVAHELSENLKPYPNQYALNACVSDKDYEIVRFHISNNEKQSSSFLELGHHKAIHPEVKYVDEYVVHTIRIDTLLNKYHIDEKKQINFLNFDLQGAELMALKGMGKLLNHIEYIYLEVNKKETYIGCPLIDEIDSFLSDFERVETGDWICDTWTDGFYIRKTLLNA